MSDLHRKYSKKQISEAIKYWESRLNEAVKYDELAEFIKKNKWDEKTALENVDTIADEFDMDAKNQGDYIKKMVGSIFDGNGGANGSDEKSSKNSDTELPDSVKKEISKASDAAVDAVIPQSSEVKDDIEEIGPWNISARLFRIHNGAAKKAKGAVQMAIKKFFTLNPNDIRLVNSRVRPDGTFDLESDKPMVVTLKVKVTETNVKGLSKFVAGLLKENDFGEDVEAITEGALGSLFANIGKGIAKLTKGTKEFADVTAADMKEKYKKGVEKANAELKDKIGVVGLQTYVKRMCGGGLESEVTAVKTGQETKGKESYLTWSVKIGVE